MSENSQNLPQLYRFCYLMTGDAGKAQEAFIKTMQEAESHRDGPPGRLWLFRNARKQCLASSAQDLQAEPGMLDESELSATAPAQIQRLNPTQLAVWISAATEPQRSALAFFYLDEFSVDEMLDLLELKVGEFSDLISSGRRQFQSWLNATTPYEAE